MALVRDTFTEEVQSTLAGEGWTFLSVQRYDPTVAAGTVPSGKTFTLTFAGGTCTLAIGTRSRSVQRASAQWETPAGALQTIRDLYAAYPANQR